MSRSKHSLHSSVDLTPAHRTAIRTAFAKLLSRRTEALAAAPEAAAAPVSYEFPLSTVSLNLNFDAYITVSFPVATAAASASLLVDSGNSMLIVPRWEDIQAIPGYQTVYTVLGQADEPWGCPANVVKGPIELIAAEGSSLVIEDCVFYACTGNPPDIPRTANFGVGCLNPWTASSWDTHLAGVTMQSPLSYSNYPYAEFDYAPAGQVMQASGADPALAGDSILRLYAALPGGYSMFDIIPNCEWMSLAPKSLGIGGRLTQWPGPGAAIAMVDTGGGPVFLSDPDGYVYSAKWPDDVANPDWTVNSVSCQSTEASVGVELGDSNGSYSYTIDDSTFPPAVQGLTLVMCEQNQYMMGQRGMNIGGISALSNYILIDFQNKRVGLKTK